MIEFDVEVVSLAYWHWNLFVTAYSYMRASVTSKFSTCRFLSNKRSHSNKHPTISFNQHVSKMLTIHAKWLEMSTMSQLISRNYDRDSKLDCQTYQKPWFMSSLFTFVHQNPLNVCFLNFIYTENYLQINAPLLKSLLERIRYQIVSVIIWGYHQYKVLLMTKKDSVGKACEMHCILVFSTLCFFLISIGCCLWQKNIIYINTL
jgi:hypothetical protein